MFGVDSQLIEDQTYLAIEETSGTAACGIKVLTTPYRIR